MKKRNYILLITILVVYINSTGLHAQQQCTLYSILSTGFNRSTQTPYTVPGSSPNGGFDSYWNVIKQEDLDASYNPTGTFTLFTTGTLPYVLRPYSPPSPSPLIGYANQISLNPTRASVYPTRNMVTYRTYFTLPSPLPTNFTYSLSFAIAADDGVYQISVNGVNLKSPGFNGPGGGAYIAYGPPMYLSVYSYNTPNAFVAGTNYIDIAIGDIGQGLFFVGADVLLYQCIDTQPPPPLCHDCISSFAPVPGKKYLISAWVKEKNPAQSKTSYTFPNIDVLFPSISVSAGLFYPSGNIIDGWQRIEGEFVIPSNATDITLKLNCSGAGAKDCYYDDVRVIPFDGSMKSYVYDPVNMRLIAELDERNYATLYEYDEEGKLIRVKKETEKGKMTIKENRDNTKK